MRGNPRGWTYPVGFFSGIVGCMILELIGCPIIQVRYAPESPLVYRGTVYDLDDEVYSVRIGTDNECIFLGTDAQRNAEKFAKSLEPRE